MGKNKHVFGSASLGNWEDIDVMERADLQKGKPLTEETAPLRRSDAVLYEDVWECLYQAADVDTSEIKVSVIEGTVILTGFINSRRGRRTASGLIKEIAGVLEVKNELWIRNPVGLISPVEDDSYQPRTTRGLINNHTGLS
jgi:hypothetical protein